MTYVIVPNELRDAIYARIDMEIAIYPDATIDRDYFYGVLLDYFSNHGEIPEFTLEKSL